MIINDLVQPVVNKLRQRSDLAPVVPYYIAMALLDITENYEFEDLKTTGPLTNFVPNIAEYLLRGYDPLGINGNPFIASNDHKITFIQSFFCFFNQSGTITPGIDTGAELNNKAWRVVEPMSKILGKPSVYCIFGGKKSNGRLVVGQMPDAPYTCQLRYQYQHIFNIPLAQVYQSVSNTNLAKILAGSEVLIDDDWVEIITLSAAEKACYDVGMNEIGASYHTQLYGYKDKKGNDHPGIITVRLTQQ